MAPTGARRRVPRQASAARAWLDSVPAVGVRRRHLIAVSSEPTMSKRKHAIEAHFQQGVRLHRAGRIAEAEQVQPPLCRLVAGLQGVGRIVRAGEPRFGFDPYGLLLNLPHLLGRTIARIARTCDRAGSPLVLRRGDRGGGSQQGFQHGRAGRTMENHRAERRLRFALSALNPYSVPLSPPPFVLRVKNRFLASGRHMFPRSSERRRVQAIALSPGLPTGHDSASARGAREAWPRWAQDWHRMARRSGRPD